MLTRSEAAYLESLEWIAVDDPSALRTLNKQLAKGIYFRSKKKPATDNMIRIRCYEGAQWSASLAFIAGDISLGGGQWFDYPESVNLKEAVYALTPQVHPFNLRWDCGGNLMYLAGSFRPLREKTGAFPVPSAWCDTMIQSGQMAYLPTALQCPAVYNGRCHYAMNVDCVPESPPDTVLLFETTAGWNQHGGPELFTLDNHDPRGGCVILRDGTLMFIRAEEGLKQLRWK